MGKRVAVVLGAGASYDLVPVLPGIGKLATTDEAYRPPLTNAIFESGTTTTRVLDKYPGAGTLSSTIRLETLKGKPLEPFLKELAESLDGPRATQFPEIPLYLQELFGLISERYTNQPFNYAALADRLFDPAAEIEAVAFITLNYDTLLEKILDSHYLPQIIDMRSYVSRRCLLIKLHGSVNWARQIVLGNVSGVWDHEKYLREVHSLSNRDLPSNLDSEVLIRDYRNRWDNSGPTAIYYPALSVPLGKYDPVCPPAHLQAGYQFLRACKNVLVIGASGRDADLFGLLKWLPQDEPITYAIVDARPDWAEQVKARFDAVPQLQSSASLHGERFSAFIHGDGLSEFISHCV